MAIESRKIVGAGAAFALVGAAVWISASLFEAPKQAQNPARTGTVEVVQLPEGTVEIKDLGTIDAPTAATRTAANR